MVPLVDSVRKDSMSRTIRPGGTVSRNCRSVNDASVSGFDWVFASERPFVGTRQGYATGASPSKLRSASPGPIVPPGRGITGRMPPEPPRTAVAESRAAQDQHRWPA